jgi:hypothetical protein
MTQKAFVISFLIDWEDKAVEDLMYLCVEGENAIARANALIEVGFVGEDFPEHTHIVRGNEEAVRARVKHFTGSD